MTVLIEGATSWSSGARKTRKPTAVIYALVDAKNPNRVRYVGRSVNPFVRFSTHATKSASTAIRLWVGEIGRLFDMIQLDECATSTAHNLERWWIRYYRSMGMADLNSRD